MMQPTDQMALLIDGLRLMALPAEEQVASLPEFEVVADEVVSGFLDAYLLVPQLQVSGRVSSEATRKLRELDEFLSGFERPPGFDAVGSLETHPFWERLRELAKEALMLLGVAEGRPRFRDVHWVRG